MKKQLIAGIIASTLASQMSYAEVNSVNNTRTVLEVNNAKARITSLDDSSINRDMLLVGRDIYEFHLKAEQAKMEREEAARKAEEERLAEEARKAEELRLELERQASVGFDDMDVTRLSNITPYELQNVLYNTVNGEGLAPYASYFVEAEQLYGINAFFICALAAQESGWGRYAAGNGTNLTGYAVYNHGYEGETFEGGIRHNILATAELLAEKYVDANGPYHTEWPGYNYGKSIYEINVRYCLKSDMKTTDFEWSSNIGRIAYTLEDVYHSLR